MSENKAAEPTMSGFDLTRYPFDPAETQAMSEQPDILTVAREVVFSYRGWKVKPRECRLAQAVIALSAALEAIVRIRPPCTDARYTDQETHNSETCRWCKARAALDGKDLGGQA